MFNLFKRRSVQQSSNEVVIKGVSGKKVVMDVSKDPEIAKLEKEILEGIKGCI